MNCFNDIIGLRGLLDGNSVSVYLDQVGITKEVLTKANYTADDIETLLLQKIDEASNVVARQIRLNKSTHVAAHDTLVNARVGYKSRSLSTVATKTGYNAGLKIEVPLERDFVKVNIDSISLFANTTGDVSVTIYDLTTGETIQTVTVAAVAGTMVYKDVNLSIRSRRGYIAIGVMYDSTFASYRTTALENYECGGCASKNLNHTKYSVVAGIKVANASSKIVENVIYEADTAGLSVVYTVQCDFEEWICRSREVAVMAVLYYTGMHIAEYALQSPRLNSNSLDMRQTIEAIKDNCETAYNNEMNIILNAMKIPQYSDCFVCRRQSTNVTTL